MSLSAASSGSSSSSHSRTSYGSHHRPAETGDGFPDEPFPQRRTLSPFWIKVIFALLGVGILIPWNAMINAKPYFQKRFCSTSSGQDVVDFELWFGLIWNISAVLSLGSILAVQMIQDILRRDLDVNMGENALGSSSSRDPLDPSPHDSDHHHQEDHSFWLVMLPLTAYMITFLGTTGAVLNVPDQNDNENTTFVIWTLASMAICGISCSIATAGLVATANRFPPSQGIAPFFAGQALGGLAISCVNFIAATWEDPTDYWEAHCESDYSFDVRDDASCTQYAKVDWAVFCYFAAACVVLGLCLYGFHVVHQVQPEHYFESYAPVHTENNPLVLSHDQSPLSGTPRSGVELNPSFRAEEELEDNIIPHVEQDASSVAIAASAASDDQLSPENGTLDVLLTVWEPAATIFVTFAVTLSLFPGWVSELQSAQQCTSPVRLANDLYIPFAFVVFNVGDFCGRLVAPYFHPRRRVLIVAALLRCGLFPLFGLCVSSNNNTNMSVPNDAYSLVVQFAFAVSNGFLISASFLFAPQLLVDDASVQEKSSELLSFAVSFGLLAGSFLSFPVVALLSSQGW